MGISLSTRIKELEKALEYIVKHSTGKWRAVSLRALYGEEEMKKHPLYKEKAVPSSWYKIG